MVTLDILYIFYFSTKSWFRRRLGGVDGEKGRIQHGKKRKGLIKRRQTNSKRQSGATEIYLDVPGKRAWPREMRQILRATRILFHEEN